MRSKIANRVLKETPEHIKKSVKEYADKMIINRSFNSLYCKRCKQPFTKEELEVMEHCNYCGLEMI